MSNTEYWVCNMQGRRSEMEDRHVVKRCPVSGWHMYAVCDGHGGKAVVNRFADNLFKITQVWMQEFRTRIVERFFGCSLFVFFLDDCV